MRMHFHAFMQYIHQQLKISQGKKEPLFFLAKQLAKNNLLICLDEFMVTDIADAMILRQFISALFKHGVCIVTTSNIMPDHLYPRGLQRNLFLPAIESIKKHLLIIHAESQQDYRIKNILPYSSTSIENNNLFKQEAELE
jgi:cell division protein ZapE